MSRVVTLLPGLLGLLGLLGGACAQGEPADVTRPIVLVSGLDDHFLPETDRVDVLARPDGPARGSVPAGTLVRALEVRGQWVRVAALEVHTHDGADAEVDGHDHDVPEGWVADYHLRGRLHVVAADPACPVPTVVEPGGAVGEPLEPSAQVEVVGLRFDGARVWARVRTVAEPVRSAWVPREALSELSGRQLVEGPGHVHGGGPTPERVASTGDC